MTFAKREPILQRFSFQVKHQKQIHWHRFHLKRVLEMHELGLMGLWSFTDDSWTAVELFLFIRRCLAKNRMATFLSSTITTLHYSISIKNVSAAKNSNSEWLLAQCICRTRPKLAHIFFLLQRRLNRTNNELSRNK